MYALEQLIGVRRWLILLRIGGRYRLGDHRHGFGFAHDTWRWVRDHTGTVTAGPALLMGIFSFFYSGLARRKSALSLIWLSLMAAGVISFQWFFWGYSLAFSHTAGKFIGDLQNIGFRNVLARPSVASDKIPDLLFAVYQGMFAAITYVIDLTRNTSN
jgi:hypothetical protein